MTADSTRASKLRRSASPEARELPCPVDWRDGLRGLIQGRFYELLAAKQWWGASIFGAEGVVPEDALEALARVGARCACVGARAGAAGYLALIAHPSDSAGWPTRVVSRAIGPGKRPDAPGLGMLFLPMGLADFPAQPQVFSINEERAMGAKRALVERAAISLALPAPRGSGAPKRL